MKIPQILAMYLPQFHRVKENDEWWGEGFTEWSTVKAAKPLYAGHRQPIEPVEYYDLLDKHVMRKQAEYMHQYGVDGMCFYHYYFEAGRKILEKPAENLLKWTEIDMPFCFYWANESWIRSWSNVSGNSWTELFETKAQPGKESVLLKQNYGGKEDWEKHFYYLLPFFQDSRYLRKDGHPVFIIYQPQEITCLKEMTDYWNELMEKEGMPTLWFIGKGTDCEVLDATMIHEPMDAWTDLWEKRFHNDYGFQYYLSYDEVWERILRKQYTQKNVCLGGFTGFDDTPRRGYKGKVIYGRTPEKFQRYFTRLLLKAGSMDCEYVFLNAWNEWGEGMYLEPDKQWGEQYLEALMKAKQFARMNGELFWDAMQDNTTVQAGISTEVNTIAKRTERYRAYWQSLSKWLQINLAGKTLCDYFKANSYKEIVIYGLGILGTPLVKELKNHGLHIAYGIDQDEHKGRKFDFPVYTWKDSLPEADVVVVTVEHAFEQIKDQLNERLTCKIISLNQVLEMTEEAEIR